MENYLMLDGKKYELSPELANALRSCVEPEPEEKSPFERRENSQYCHIDTRGKVVDIYRDLHDNMDNALFSVANYCTDKALMEQRAMHETLNRLLWRYSEEHGGDNPWDGFNDHWVIITVDGDMQKIGTNFFNSSKLFGVTYFCDKETADAAIEEIVKPFLAAHPDFVW